MRFHKRTIISAILIAVALIGGLQTGLILATPSAGQTATISGAFAQGQPCSYFVFTDGTTTYAKNCDTGGIAYQNANAATVFNNVLSASNMRVVVGPGTFLISTTILIASHSWLIGSGMSVTMLNATAGLDVCCTAMIANLHAPLGDKGSGITDLSIDGMSIGFWTGTVHGIHWYTNGQPNVGLVGLTVQNVAVFHAAGFGIKVEPQAPYLGGEAVIENVHVIANRDGGIYVEGGDSQIDHVYAGGYQPVLELVGGSYTVSQSYFGGDYPSTTFLSPCDCQVWLNGAGVAIFTGNIIDASIKNGVTAYNSYNVTFSDNLISGSSKGTDATYYNFNFTGTTSNVMISSNTFQEVLSSNRTNTMAYFGSATRDITFSNNIISTITFANSVFNVNAGLGHSIIGNQIRTASTWDHPAIIAAANDTIISSNTIFFTPPRTNANYGIQVTGYGDIVSGNIIRYSYYGIYVNGAGKSTILGNNIQNSNNAISIQNSPQTIVSGNMIISGTSPTLNLGIYLTGSTTGEVTGNVIYGSSSGTGSCIWGNSAVTNVTIIGNMVNSCANGYYEQSGNYNLVANNYFGPSLGTKVSATYGNYTRFFNNMGFNPIGRATNFVFAGGTAAGDGTFIGPRGTSTTLVASTTYTIISVQTTIIFRVIGSTSLTIDGGTAFTPSIGDAFTLLPGETINFGAFGGSPPTIQVDFQ